MDPLDTTRVRPAVPQGADAERTRLRGGYSAGPGAGEDHERTRVRPSPPAGGPRLPALPALLPPVPPLPTGTRLHEYRIDAVLGQGGFGITYLATDVHLSAKVAIKEFLPEGIVFRSAAQEVRPAASAHAQRYAEGLKSFLAEARTLAALRHPAIVRVARFFEANGTAYMVLEYEEGQPLRTWWPAHRHIGEARWIELLLPLLEGLAAVHAAGFLHRDIKPDNIQVRAADGSLVLLDFGSAAQLAALGGEGAVAVTPGYAPIEQHGIGEQGPWTDLYALAATLYWAATARRVPDAEARAANPALFVPAGSAEAAEAIAASGQRWGRAFLAALDAALQTDPLKRPRDVAQFRLALCADHVASLDLSAALAHDADGAGAAGSAAVGAAGAARAEAPWRAAWRRLRARRWAPRDWPLAFKLAVLLVATALLPMGLAGLWNVRGGTEALAGAELRNLERIARGGAGRIGQFIADARHVARGLAGDAEFAAFLERPAHLASPASVAEPAEAAALQRRLQGLVRADPDLQLIILMDLQGRAVVSSDPEVTGRSFAFRRYFREASAGRPYTSGIVVGAVAGASGFFVAEPVPGPDGSPVGVLVLRVLAASVAQLMDELGPSAGSAGEGAGQDALVPMLLDGDGVVLHHPRRERIFASLAPLGAAQQAEIRADQRFRRERVASLGEDELARLVAAGGAAGTGHGAYRSAQDRRDEIAGFAAVPGHDWRVVVAASRHAFEAPMRALFMQLLVSLALVGALFTGLALRVARGIVRPVRELTAAADALKAGDFDAARVQVRGRDEVGQLGRTFNVMIEVLRQREARRRGERR